MTRCKHCGGELRHSSSGYIHADGLQAGKHRCPVEPYGFLAEPEGAPCSRHPANPCNGARGLVPEQGTA